MISNSYWLVYVVDFLPLIGFGLIAVMLAVMIYNWRALSDAIGFGMSKRRKEKRKKSRTVQLIVWMATWLIAIVVLLDKCGGIFCKTPSQAANLSDKVTNAVSGPGQIPSPPLLNVALQLNALIQANWFYAAFLGFLVVSGLIIVRAYKVSLDELRAGGADQILEVQQEGAAAVQDAIRIIETESETDPRTKIIMCHQRMIKAAQQRGTMVTSDLTARELERAIRKMLLLTGSAIGDLTKLFEEARYSKHEITSEHAELARRYLLSIAEEMKIPVSVLS
ncbi:MAG TPA: DUF4129 domain-containing protein [Candidatus Bathyarchaeia archaeon]|nr:DUF4129 domain-containing protein [Candidatus Bathyarchaeia archaeon]